MPVVADETQSSVDERHLRRSVATSRFHVLFRFLVLTLGLQACAISMVVNGFIYLSFKRLFLLSMEVFIPFGQGSGETLEGPELMFAGIAMACTFALPLLPLSYLVKIDGRVLQYGATLVAAFFAAAVLQSQGLDRTVLVVTTALLFALPSVVTTVLASLLAFEVGDKGTRPMLIFSAVAAAASAAILLIAAPGYGFVNQVRDFPPAILIDGFEPYAVLLGYALQLSLVYIAIQRMTTHLCDASTISFVKQHLVFHVGLAVTSFALLVGVHSQALASWASIPASLGALIAVVSLGFNLWSMAQHIEPYLDRFRKE